MAMIFLKENPELDAAKMTILRLGGQVIWTETLNTWATSLEIMTAALADTGHQNMSEKALRLRHNIREQIQYLEPEEPTQGQEE